MEISIAGFIVVWFIIGFVICVYVGPPDNFTIREFLGHYIWWPRALRCNHRIWKLCDGEKCAWREEHPRG